LPELPGVDNGILLREGDEATDETEVEGEGGLVGNFPLSFAVTTFGGFLARCEILRL
jgi:hypothetical protein